MYGNTDRLPLVAADHTPQLPSYRHNDSLLSHTTIVQTYWNIHASRRPCTEAP